MPRWGKRKEEEREASLDYEPGKEGEERKRETMTKTSLLRRLRLLTQNERLLLWETSREEKGEKGRGRGKRRKTSLPLFF